MAAPSIVWFRQDLRIADQPALAAAARDGPVVPVYVLDDDLPGQWKIGGAQRWWLHHSLARLSESLERLGSRLILRRGNSLSTLAALAADVGAARIHATHQYEPWWMEAEQALSAGHDLVLHAADVLAPPEQIQAGGGRPYKIYTPYWRALQRHLPPAAPEPAPQALAAPPEWPRSEKLNDWHLLPTRPNWAVGFGEIWTPGEDAATERLREFVNSADAYAECRDLPGAEGTSRFSPHLHFGELSPRLVWHSLPDAAGDKFRKELAWRDFSRNVMLADPQIGERAQRAEFDAFPWRSGRAAETDFKAWSKGRTGYPIVDAGMRELWATGWMHNRARLLTASFLVKHLLIDWRRGAEWFWDTLVDADYGNNSQNWQWIAGTGLDSQPMNRIMAPTLQSRKFDAAGYIRRWVPELASLGDDAIHEPGKARPSSYPPPIIEHRAARERAFAAMRSFHQGR